MPRVIPPSMNAFMGRYVIDDNAVHSVVFTLRDGTVLAAQDVRIAKASQQQAGVSDYIAMGLQVVNVIGSPSLNVEVGATFDHDSKKWEVREPTVVGADNVTRTALAVTTIG